MACLTPPLNKVPRGDYVCPRFTRDGVTVQDVAEERKRQRALQEINPAPLQPADLLQLINCDRVQCTLVCSLIFTFLSWHHLASILISLIGWSLEAFQLVADHVLDMFPSNSDHFCFLSG